MLSTKLEAPDVVVLVVFNPQPRFRAGHVRTKPAFKVEMASLSSGGPGHEPYPPILTIFYLSYPPLTKGRNPLEG